MPQSQVALGPQQTTWTPGVDGGPAGTAQLEEFTGTWLIGAGPVAPANTPTAWAMPYIITNGLKTIYVELSEANVGTATLNIEGSYDGVNWYAVGYQQVDGVLAPARAVAAIAQAQNARHVYQILDPYPLLRVRPSANAGVVSAEFYCIPV